MIDIAQKFALIREACEQLRGPEYCTDTVVQGIAAIARHETGFGTYRPFARPATSAEPAWDSHNWGAMQCGAKADKDGKCPEGCFPARDSSPVTGSYLGCFQVHPDADTGALAFVRLVTVSRPGIAAALPSGDARRIAEAMYEARYYEGHGATVEERIAGYASALLRNAQVNAAQARVELLLHEPPPPPPPPPPTPEEYGLLAALGIAALAAALKALLPPKTPVD
jgi:hypothetical protein